MNRRLFQIAAVLALTPFLVGAACDRDTGPATIKGECAIFDDPGFAVAGATPKDQNWISETQETGIGNCDWKRPPPRVLDLPAAAPPPGGELESEPEAVPLPAKRRTGIGSWFGT